MQRPVWEWTGQNTDDIAGIDGAHRITQPLERQIKTEDPMSKYVSAEQVADYQRDGVVCIKGLFKDWVPVISEGIERNMREPSQYAAENLKPGEGGRFFDDYCNWERIPEFG